MNTIVDATAKGYLGYRLEVSLALAQIKMESNVPPTARQDLQTVGQETKAKRFGLIARKATAAKAKTSARYSKQSDTRSIETAGMDSFHFLQRALREYSDSILAAIMAFPHG